MPTSPGSVIATRYVVLREIGRGGMATVLEVRDMRTDRRLALKILKPEIAAHPEAVERFRREGEFLSGLKHPALIAVEAVGTLPDGRLFLAMELLEGETLGERIRRSRLSPTEISPILAGSAVGLDAAHRAGVIHRDLKPDNIFLARPPGGGAVQVKLLDFGISKIDGRASLTRTGQVLGTPRYMAPEQLRGEPDLDPRIDVYALGVILYEALAGQPAFPSQNPSELIVAILNGRVMPLRAIRPDVPVEVEAVIMRAMARTREARFGSAIELAQEWFDVVHRHDGPKGVRTGVHTSVLGGIGESVRPPAMDEDALRPATFREFEARLPKLAPVEEGPPLASLANDPGMKTPEVTVPATSVERAPASPRSDGADRSDRSEPRAERSPAPAEPAEAQTPSAAAAEPVSLPRRSSAGPLFFGSILGLVGVLLLGFAYFLGKSSHGGTRPGTAGPALVVPGVPMIPSAVAFARDAGSDAGTIAAGNADAGAADVVSDVDAGRRAVSRPVVPAPTESPAETPTPVPEPEEPEQPSDASAILSRARLALQSGNARLCVEHATEAIAAGADPSAYKLRGDCYRALGDMPRALRSYQRFCTIAPNSSQIEAARRAAEALGGTCP